MQDKDVESSSSDMKIWEDHPIESYINNSMMTTHEYRFDEFDKKVLNSVASKINRDTGEIRYVFNWLKIGTAIMEEAVISVKTKSIPGINPIESIRKGKIARRKTKVLKEFYIENIQSGKYQMELVKACKGRDDPDKVNEAIVDYLRMLMGDLERRLDNCGV